MNEHVPASATTDDPTPSAAGPSSTGPRPIESSHPSLPSGGSADAGREVDDAVLEQLESDLAAVEQAIERLDQITEAGIGGEQAAERIEDAVPADRFRIAQSEDESDSESAAPVA